MASRPVSFRLRLTSALTLVAALGLVSAGGLAWLVEQRRADAAMDASLVRAAQELRNYAGLEDSAPLKTFSSTRELIGWVVRQAVNGPDECTLGFTGPVLPVTSGPAEVCARFTQDHALMDRITAVTMDASVLEHAKTGRGDYGLLVVPVVVDGDPNEGHYAVVIDRGARQAEVRRGYLTTYSLVALGAIAIIVAAAWALSGQILRPLRSLVTRTRAIASPQTTDRLDTTGPDEVAELARALNSMLDRLAATFESERQLLNDVGHELRTPLTIVRGHLELADPDDPDDFDATKALALDEVDRMHALVDDLVTLAQADRPDFVRLRPTELAPLLDDVLDKARTLGDRRWRIGRRTELAAPADPMRLTQALLELAANAVKYSPEGSTVTLELVRAGQQAQFSVKDEGVGIPADLHERVFERFGRTPGSDRRAGAGLGLAIVARVAAAHGGHVAVDSAVGQGSVFHVVVPLREPGTEDSP